MPQHWTKEDMERLRPRNRQVLQAMDGAGWITLDKVAKMIGMRQPSTIASRLRDIKAETPFTYEMRRTDILGLNEYRLFMPNHLVKDSQTELFPID